MVHGLPQIKAMNEKACDVVSPRSGLSVKPDDCPVTQTVRAALYATDLQPSEDDVIGLVRAIKDDHPQVQYTHRTESGKPSIQVISVLGKTEIKVSDGSYAIGLVLTTQGIESLIDELSMVLELADK